MRPSVGETLLGIRTILNEDVLPHLSEHYARRRVKDITAALKQLERRWDRFTPNLMEENDELRALLADVRAAAQTAQLEAADENLAALDGAIRQGLDAQVGDLSKYPIYDRLEDENLRYRGLVVKTIEALEQASDTHPDNPDLTAARGAVRRALRRSVDRQLDERGIELTERG